MDGQANSGAAQGVAVGSGPAAGVADGLGPSAKESAISYGGNPGGKPRKDGLVPGSAEARAVDRAKDRERKRRQRARHRAENPPALPARDPAPLGQYAPGIAPQAGGLDRGPVAGPVDPVGAAVPWKADNFLPLLEKLVPDLEKADVGSLTRKAVQANLPPELLKEIEKDARWGDGPKRAVIDSGAKVGAKWMNKAGVSSEWEPEVSLGVALLIIGGNRVSLGAKLDKIIAAQEAGQTAGKDEAAKN